MNLFGSFKTDYLILFILSCLGSFSANADDSVTNHKMSASEKNTTESHQMDDHNGHGKTPAGIYGANMILKKSVELKVIIGSVRIIGAKPWYYPQKLFTQKVTQN